MSADTHPSFYDLDLCALGVRTPELDAHLGGCEQCRSHVLRVTTPTPLPPAVRERASDPWAGVMRRWRAGWLTAGVGAATVTAVLLARTPPTVAPTEPWKGNPSIALYVKRDAAIALWDGSAPMRPGDRIQLKVATEGYRHIAVGSVDHGRPTWLYSGEAGSSEPFMLPTSWVVDDAPGAERLTIVLSRDALPAAELDADSRAQLRNHDVWTTALVLSKQSPEKP